ncbi:MAG: hypothetical protein A2020_01585 [Lentisphaerae bacterium GWF2_45_14]|nr:MAG: hypothetical protein A2020_01585 [Lentisphaerae bacterium GWF2_45_14]
MDSDGSEMTIRDATVFTLEKSLDELKKINADFKKASGLFEEAKDSEALSLIASEIVPQIRNLFEFCHTILSIFGDVLDQPLREQLQNKYLSLEELMNGLIDETSKGNLTEVGDIMRFDFADLLNDISMIFPKVADCFRKSEKKELDNY